MLGEKIILVHHENKFKVSFCIPFLSNEKGFSREDGHIRRQPNTKHRMQLKLAPKKGPPISYPKPCGKSPVSNEAPDRCIPNTTKPEVKVSDLIPFCAFQFHVDVVVRPSLVSIVVLSNTLVHSRIIGSWNRIRIPQGKYYSPPGLAVYLISVLMTSSNKTNLQPRFCWAHNDQTNQRQP